MFAKTKYLASAETAEMKKQGWHVLKVLNGYLRYLRDKKAGSSLALHESSASYGRVDSELGEWLANLPFDLNMKDGEPKPI